MSVPLFIGKDALSRTLVGVGLKSVGALARIGDVPPEYPRLRRQGITREATVIGIIAVASLLLEFAFKFIPPAVRNRTLVQFVPQALAYCLAEWYSRKSTQYTQALRHALAGQEQAGSLAPMPLQPVKSTPPIDAFMKNPLFLSYQAPPPIAGNTAFVYGPVLYAGNIRALYPTGRYYYA